MPKYTAIIVEPRKHRALSFVLDNFLSNLSDEWSIILFHGTTNLEYARDSIQNLEEKHNQQRITMLQLNVANLTGREYSDLFMTASFYHHIPTETFLVFQTDSMILSENKDQINLFLQYDYVGAPWREGVPWASTSRVGNGGLSLRKKSKMLEIIQHKGYIRQNEDVYFSQNIPNTIPWNVPTVSDALLFSIETVFGESPFGIHNCWRYLSKEDMDSLIRRYGDIQTLVDLQNNSK